MNMCAFFQYNQDERKLEGTLFMMSTEARLSVFYFITACLWIFVTDLLVVPMLGLSENVGQLFAAYKGWFYVTITALGLYLTLRREFRRRRQIEAQAIESKRLMERVIHTVPEAIQLIDLDQQKSVFLNERARQIFGDASHPTGNDLTRLATIIHPDDLVRLPQFVERCRAAADNEVVEVDYRVRDDKGGWRFMNSRSIVFSRNADGSVAQVLSIAHDITERKLAEEQLMFQVNVLNNVSDAIITVDPEYKVITWNPAAESIYGYSADEVVGKSLAAPLQTEYLGAAREEAIDSIRTHGYWRGEIIQRRKDGTPLHILNASTALKDHQGQLIGVVAVNRDITEQKRLHEHARKNERLRLDLERELQARTLRNRFMSTVSHEFRTPLTTIQLAAELLDRYFDRLTDSGRQERLAQIVVEVKRLLDMLDDILLFLKTEDTSQLFAPLPVNLAALTEEIVSEFRVGMDDPARLRCNVKLDTSRVLADAKVLRQAIVNLVSNAIKYSSPEQPVTVRVTQGGGRVSLSVQDQGIGIAPQDLGRLGEAFYRGANVTNIPGTGLGMLITRQAVELHGGTLEIDSEIGKGTTMTIHLPLAASETLDSSAPHA